ncbi:hypothetical protein ABH937_003483 [Kitasatospora sp. GAS1066B]
MGRWHTYARGRGVGAALLAAALCAGTPLAFADPGPAVFTVAADGSALLAPGGGYQALSIAVLAGDGRSTLAGVQLTVDAWQLAGVGELRLPAQCAFTAPLRADCALGDLANGGGVLQLGVRAAAGAVVGASGGLRYTVTAANARESGGGSDRTTVTVGDGPDLSVARLPALISVGAGSPTPIGAAVTDQGDRDARGLVLSFQPPAGYALRGDYGNCSYPVTPGGPDGWVLCRFDDTVLHPGQVLRPAVPIAVTVPGGGGDAPAGGLFSYAVDVTGGPLDQRLSNDLGGHRPGGGASLTLVPGSGGDFGSASSSSVLQSVESGLLVPIASDVSGSVGETVSTAFAVRDTGDRAAPADPGSAGLNVQLPAGVRVVAAPVACAVVTGTDTGQYLCQESRVLRPGESAGFTFQLQLTAPLDHAAGHLTLRGATGSADFTVTALAVAPSAGPTGGSPSAVLAAPASSAAAGPVDDAGTGPSSSALAPPLLSFPPTDSGISPGRLIPADARPSAGRTTATPAASDLAVTGGRSTLPMALGGAAVVAGGIALTVLATRRPRAGNGPTRHRQARSEPGKW